MNLKFGELRKIAFKEITIIKDFIFWIDVVSDGEDLNNVIFARPFNAKGALSQQLTSDEFNIKSTFHGYGGTSYKCLELENKIYLIWIDQVSKALWFQIFEVVEKLDESEIKFLKSVQESKQISKAIDGNFDSSFAISKENFLYGICEIEKNDYLFSLNLEKTNEQINIIKKFDNFAGDLSSNPSAHFISWIEWDTPYMPWENNGLFFAEIVSDGLINNIKKFSSEFLNFSRTVSFFQPYWISDNVLLCSEDSSGWWNLLFIDVLEIDNIVISKRIKKKFSEYGSPQWVSGLTFFSGSFQNLFCLVKKINKWKLEYYQDLELIKEFDLPFSSVSDLNASDKKLVLKGNGSNFESSLLEMDFEKKVSFNPLEEITIKSIHEYSKPESFWFKGFDDKSTHSFIYKPLIEVYKKPPLLIRAHSGPTACFDGSYNSEVQYWTSKGFFVAEVNYGGSSGFGRAYRDRLNYKWGIVDSYDCRALVRELFQLNIVDRDKVVIFGNSAGGLTALNSLYDSDLFKAAICKYPVLDIIDMYHNTHRFEKDYLNSLIGNYETFKSEYKVRSPINKISEIKKPILLFHGKNDPVISYKILLKIKELIINNHQYSDVIFFENEGHGFKKIENKNIVMRKTEEFLCKTLSI